MPAPAEAYFVQPQLDLRFSVYSSDGRLAYSADGLALRDIETRGEAEDYRLDLIAADEIAGQQAAFDAVSPNLEADIAALIAKQQAENAALDDFEAQAHAMAYGPAVTERAA